MKEMAERPGHRCKGNSEMDCKAVGQGGMDWINLAEDRSNQQALLNTLMNFQAPQNAGNFLTIRETNSLTRTLRYGVSQSDFFLG